MDGGVKLYFNLQNFKKFYLMQLSSDRIIIIEILSSLSTDQALVITQQEQIKSWVFSHHGIQCNDLPELYSTWWELRYFFVLFVYLGESSIYLMIISGVEDDVSSFSLLQLNKLKKVRILKYWRIKILLIWCFTWIWNTMGDGGSRKDWKDGGSRLLFFAIGWGCRKNPMCSRYFGILLELFCYTSQVIFFIIKSYSFILT